jgi:hypothetical protein
VTQAARFYLSVPSNNVSTWTASWYSSVITETGQKLGWLDWILGRGWDSCRCYHFQPPPPQVSCPCSLYRERKVSHSPASIVAATKLHASRSRKDFIPPLYLAALSQHYSVASLATLRIMSCAHLPGLCCSCCKVVRFCCDLEACNLVTDTIVQRIWMCGLMLRQMDNFVLTHNRYCGTDGH